ncbi:hypothetical protein HRbin15_01558 [bacterium HR15]|nr:hypothetical protein HRbin15_01558 [bacterium HR15]
MWRKTIWLMGLLMMAAAKAQFYHNIVNRPFETVSNGPQHVIVVDIDRVGRSPDAIDRLIRERVERATRAQIAGARPLIRLYKQMGLLPADYQLPIFHTVILRQNGRLILPTRTRDGGLGNGTLTIQVQDGDNPFPRDYKDFLQAVASNVLALVEAEYGKAARTLTITVVNYDDQMADRDAVVGGVYDVSNSRFLFAVYGSREAAAVNLLYLIVRAFHADVGFAYDAWEEGFARAVTARIARGNAFRQLVAQILGVRPEAVAPSIDLTLDNNYDARPYYDAWNQPVLGSPSFIAPSLRQSPIQPGTTGGIWLVRYLMATSAWLKLATEYPSFFREFNTRYYARYTPGLEGNIPTLRSIARETLSALSGSATPTVEGFPFDQWYRQQYILDTSVTYGRKLHAQMFPYISNPQPDEQAVFTVFLNYFQTIRTASGGWDEALLNGTSYPIYWDFHYNRLTLSPQYERVDIRVGTGTVVPSFTGDALANQRLTVDFSVGTEIARVVYPSSKVQGTNFRNNFFGVVYGLDNGSVLIDIGGEQKTVSVDNGAFGTAFSEQTMSRERIARLTFFDAQSREVGRAQVNTGIGFQFVIVRLQPASDSFRLDLPAGLSMFSVPLRPFETDWAKLLNIPADQLRLAHWRQERFNYVYYPETPAPAPGVGYFIRTVNSLSVTIQGEPAPLDRDFAIALQPGWNLIGHPFKEAIDLRTVRVVHQFDAPVSWESATESIGNEPPLVGSRVWTLGGAGNYISTTLLEPGKAYWVRVLRPEGVTLLIPPPSRGRSHVASSRAAEEPAWAMDLTLQSPAGGAVVTLGLDTPTRARRAWAKADAPPALPGMTLLGILEGDQLLLQDTRPLGGRQVWTLQVVPGEPDREHTLTWRIPNTRRAWRITLENPVTGERIDMRRQAAYRFTPGGVQTLRVVLEPANRLPVRIVGVQVAATRGNTLTIRYQLTGEATVRAEIRSARGDTLRLLQPSRAVSAGTQSLTWNGRDSQERTLPPGTYMLHIEAMDSEGHIARAVTPILLTR